MKEQDIYYAFISHNDADEEWAKWLQYNLEYYNIPSALCKDYLGLPKKIRPVFWYKHDISGVRLKTAIDKALSSSKFLIVICSPDSVNSYWVNYEINEFIRLGKADKIIPFIVAGKIKADDPKEECIPHALRSLTRDKEIRGIDVRREQGKFHALVDVIATMFDIRFDVLWKRHERRTKIIRNIWVTIGLLLSFIIGYSCYKKSSQCVYFADYVFCDMFPKGIGEIKKSDVNNRYVSYKFVYRFKHFFDKRRTLVRIERVNANNTPTKYFSNYSYLVEGFANSIYPIMELEDNGIFLYDENNNKKEHWQYTRMKTQDGDFLIADVKRIQHNRDLDQYNYIIERKNKANINRFCYELDSNGYYKSITYHANTSGNLIESNCVNSVGAYGYRFQYDSLNRIKEICVINSKGVKSVDNNGINKIKYTYTNLGMESVSSYDINGKPIISDFLLGAHYIYCKLDSYGNIESIINYDDNMNLCNCKYGFSVQQIKYNMGHPTEVICYDHQNNRANNIQTMCSKSQTVFDSKGREIKTIFYDTQDRVCHNIDGTAYIEYKYDGNIRKRTYYDKDYNPTISKISGYTTLIQEYNSSGQVISSTCLGADGDKIVNKGGYCTQKMEYNALGELKSIELYDDSNKLIVGKDGYAIYKCELSNDRNGNTIYTISFFGKDREPIYNKADLFHKAQYTYNDEGNLIEENYYDVQEEKCLNSLGYASASYLYNIKGQIITRSFYDCYNQSVLLDNKINYSSNNEYSNIIGGFAKDSVVYLSDSKRVIYRMNKANIIDDCEFCSAIEVEESRGDTLINFYYNKNMELTDKYGGYAIRVAIFDELHRPKDVLYYDKDSVRCNIDVGISRMSNKFDDKGNRIECSFYNKNDILTNVSDKGAIIHFTYDSRNNETLRFCLGNDKKTVHSIEQGYGFMQKYDDKDRVIEQITIDTAKTPYILPNIGYAIKRIKYDEYGNMIEESFYINNNIPVNSMEGFHKIVYEYDSNNRLKKRSIYNTIGENVSIIDVHSQEYEYEQNNISLVKFYGKNNNYINTFKYIYDCHHNVDYIIDDNNIKQYIRIAINDNNKTYILLKWKNWNILHPINNYVQTLYQLTKFSITDAYVYNTQTDTVELIKINSKTQFNSFFNIHEQGFELLKSRLNEID